MGLLKTWQKNKSEIIALGSGAMPSFMYGKQQFSDIPVFCFHSARFPDFEKQLAFLSANGFKTLDADELLERRLDPHYKNNGKEIALTFDDGLASVWTVAFPLLEKYQQKIISFVLPEMMIDGSASRTIAGDITSIERDQLVNRDYSDSPLCTWSEIKNMHESGLVDIQSHGTHHQRVATSSNIVDFIHPDFDLHHYGNIHVPRYRSGEVYSREPILGHPVYEYAPLLGQRQEYLDPLELREHLADYVNAKGGKSFFSQTGWREQLYKQVSDYRALHKGPEAFRSLDDDIKQELSVAKQLIEEKLAKKVNHFCFPWFAASEYSARLAFECGYQSVHLGALPGFSFTQDQNMPDMVTRLQEEFLLALPNYRSKLAPFTYKLTKKAQW